MVDVPPEIWHYVSRFVPDEQLCMLLGVNSVFLDIGMDIRWREVSIGTRNTTNAMRILKRLSDPYVANRMHKLSLHLTHVKGHSTHGSQENANDFKHLKQQFNLTINRVFNFLRGDNHEAEALSHNPKRPRPTFSNVIDGIIDATPLFVNVRDLTIDSWDLPPSYDLKSLFASFWKSPFGPNLRALSLGGNMEGYRIFIQSNPSLKHLKDLRLEFTNNLFRVDLEEDAGILVDIVAPFVNSLSSHLETLRIWSWASLDLSVFFKSLAVLPMLHGLNVRMPFNKALRDDPSGLKDLISNCSATLQKLDLRLNPSGLPVNPVLEEPLSQWLTDCVADERCFAQLRSLDIYPTTMTAGVDVLLACIRRAADTLTHLTVRDRYLQPPEVEQVVNVVAKCTGLTYLKLNIWRLDVALLDLLAAKVPGVRHLWLSVGEVLSNANNENGGLGHAFLQDLNQRSYTNWKLKDISIWQGGSEMDRDTMLALARTIPSVNSFFEQGHMDLTQ
ncbi:hypothetical protein GALMADRAFT_247234 [Galerina marginata CBS 339.88]|uniref:F-box domain-containing protein n=1 Tax=Galerina marginata (strain CBS 339.88) TaxID=685588 RepID=A0A067TAL8_GALM3|nr:hypothetical protein GALMADRAFT_247234 [Galerina marginata CBS 339.88]